MLCPTCDTDAPPPSTAPAQQRGYEQARHFDYRDHRDHRDQHHGHPNKRRKSLLGQLLDF